MFSKQPMLEDIPPEIVREHILPVLDRLSVIALSCTTRYTHAICKSVLPAFGTLTKDVSLECVLYTLRHHLSTDTRVFVQLCRAGACAHLLTVVPKLKLDPYTLEQGLLRAVASSSPTIITIGVANWWRGTVIPLNVLCHVSNTTIAELLSPQLTEEHYQYGDGHVLRELISKNLKALFQWCISKHSYGRVMADVDWYVDEVHWPVWQMLRAAVEPPNTAESTLFFYRAIREHVYVYSRNEIFARVQHHFRPVIDTLAMAGRVNVLWWLHNSAQIVTPRELMEIAQRYRLTSLLEMVFWRYPLMSPPSLKRLRLTATDIRWICVRQQQRLNGFINPKISIESAEQISQPADGGDDGGAK
jgi:hypothetical protein